MKKKNEKKIYNINKIQILHVKFKIKWQHSLQQSMCTFL